MPAPGPHVPLRAGRHADDFSEAHVRQADPDLAADRARPRALHPLLPLHALLRGGRRRRAPDRAEPGRTQRNRDLRGRALRVGVLRQRDRAVPGRRAHVEPLPLRRAAVGDPERAHRLYRLRCRLQHLGDDPRGEGQAHPLAQPRRGRPRLALRQGAVLVPAPARARPHRRAAPPWGEGAQGRVLGRGARRRRGDAARGPGRDRDRALGLGDERDRVRAGAAAARRPRRALRGAARGDLGRARRVPAAALGDRGRRARRGRGRRPRRREGADRGALDPRGAPPRGRCRRLLADRADARRAGRGCGVLSRAGGRS